MNSSTGSGATATELTGTAGRSPGQAGGAGAARGRRPASPLLVGGAWTVVALAAFAVYLRLASTREVNSDGASIALQGWDMLHGNVLLRGWTLADVTFYATEVPQYALVELVRGLNQNVVHIAAAMTYTLVLVFVALAAKGATTGREAVARVAIAVGIMIAPQLASGTNVLLSSPDHLGTSVPLLGILLVIDRVRRPGLLAPVATSLLLAWAQLADSVVLLAAVIPVIGVCALRVASSGRQFATRRYEISLAIGALVSVGVAELVYRAIRMVGGYAQRPLGTQLAPLGQILGHNLPIAAQCLLLLPGADFLGLPAGASTDFVALHLVGVAAAGAGIVLAAWRFRRRNADQAEGLTSQLLLVGIVVSFVAFVVTGHVFNIGSAREIAPALPFAAVLAGREIAPHLRGAGLVALGVVLAGYLAGLGLELSTPPASPQTAPLSAWLSTHHIGTGLGGYWQANVVALTDGGRAAVLPVAVVDGRVVRYNHEYKADWFDPTRSTADFVVMFSGIPEYPGFTNRSAILATFGKPDRTYQVGKYTILWWHKNLLTSLH